MKNCKWCKKEVVPIQEQEEFYEMICKVFKFAKYWCKHCSDFNNRMCFLNIEFVVNEFFA
jgi:hypothetical protein